MYTVNAEYTVAWIENKIDSTKIIVLITETEIFGIFG